MKLQNSPSYPKSHELDNIVSEMDQNPWGSPCLSEVDKKTIFDLIHCPPKPTRELIEALRDVNKQGLQKIKIPVS